MTLEHFAQHVVATDGDEKSVQRLRHNCAHNGETGRAVQCELIRWGAAAPLTRLLEGLRTRYTGIDGSADWQRQLGSLVVPAADVCYEESAVALLFASVRQLLQAAAAAAVATADHERRGCEPARFLLAFCHRNVQITFVTAAAAEADARE